jgi:hypothetical protein
MPTEQIFFSPASLGFYKGEDAEYYEAQGSWPADLVELTEAELIGFWKQSAPFNKILGVKDGRLAWIDAPPPPPLSDEEASDQALGKRDDLLRTAAIRIDPLQDAVDVDDATPEDVALLTKWKKYRVALNRIENQASFPQAIEWPVVPE